MVSEKVQKLDKIIYEKEGNIARIILNYPEKLNVFDFPGEGGLLDQFYVALREAEADDDVKVVIIKGKGRSFTAGHDLTRVGFIYGFGSGKAGEKRPGQRVRLDVDHKWFDYHRSLLLCPKITICQVHGHCVGDGMIMLCCTDLAIASEDTQIAHNEQRIGFAGSGVPNISLLIMTVGLKRAMDFMLRGEYIDGKEAEKMGLVNKAVPIDKLEEETEKLAKAMTLLPRDGIAIGKAHRYMIYERLGLTAGFAPGTTSHTLFTNLRWEPGEYSFFKERRDKGAKVGFHGKDERYKGLTR